MSSNTYDPKSVEPRIYETWEKAGHFHAEPDPRRKPFVITIPPPNVTGALHLGHALNNTLQDIMIRRKRMQGYNACWLPGTDHAGIATQAVVEKRLREEQKLTRHEIGREGLVKKIWEWKEEYNARILNQLRRMGCSCDWQRTRFTLDEQCAKAVYETFFRLFKDGLIYRGLRLVNWDTQLQTAVADDEVYHENVKGSLWHIRYPIAKNSESGSAGTRERGQSEIAADPASVSTSPPSHLPTDAVAGRDYLVVATTRPETLLADTAVAVHPDDGRYKHLLGGQDAGGRETGSAHVVLPLTGRTIPVVADGMLVSKEFGTGCVKVTPGHDPNDYACYQRKLGKSDEIEIRNMMTPDGRVHDDNAGAGGAYKGLKLEEARKKMVADLEAAGLLEKVEPYETQVGHSDRSKAPIQPFLSEQWFVKMEKLAETAMEAVRDGRVRFFPDRYAKTYLDWLGEKRDWCISRQLWWGHRIPVWTREMTVRELFDEKNSPLQWFMEVYSGCASVVVEELDRSRTWYGLTGDPAGLGSKLEDRAKRLREELTTPGHKVRVLVCAAPHLPLERGERDQIAKEHLESGAFSNEMAESFIQGDPFARVRHYLEQEGFTQDPDVLDTWFSSALWPHSTFGWPGSDDAKSDGLRDLNYFYPTSVLSTAREIITLWVARMVMTGLYNVGRVPFQHVYIHAVIQDGHGKRMSKSAGNGVDPLDIIDAYGADALRITLAQTATETQDIRMPVKPTQLADGRTVNTSELFERGRNLANKLWQAAIGLVLPSIEGIRVGSAAGTNGAPAGAGDTFAPSHVPTSQQRFHTSVAPQDLPLFDRWIRTRLQHCIDAVNEHLDGYRFANAMDELRNFFWGELCDWYLEEIKVRLKEADEQAANDIKIVLLGVFDTCLCLLHPAMPFVTEEIWQRIGEVAPRHHEIIWPDPANLTPELRAVWGDTPPEHAPLLIAAPWPERWGAAVDELVDRQVGDVLQPVIRALRDVRATVNALRSQSKQSPVRQLPSAGIRANGDAAKLLESNLSLIRRLGQCESIEIGANVSKPPESATRVLSGGVEVYVPIGGLADLSAARAKIEKEHGEVAGVVEKLRAKLDSDFASKAPTQVVAQERARLADLENKLTTLDQHLADLA